MPKATCTRCHQLKWLPKDKCHQCVGDLRRLAAGPPVKKPRSLRTFAPEGPRRANFDDDLPFDKKPLFWHYFTHYMESLTHLREEQRVGLAVATARRRILHPQTPEKCAEMRYKRRQFKFQTTLYNKSLIRLDSIQRGVLPPYEPTKRPRACKDYVPPPRSKTLDIG